MKVLLATAIFPPDVGGPAVYAEQLKQGLEEQGIEVVVCSYQGLKKYPRFLRFLLYTVRLHRQAKHADIIYSFNLTSCGLPALKTARGLNKKLVIRIGGDFLWERAVEKGRTKKPLREYYAEPKTSKEKFWLKKMKEVLQGADKIIFTTHFQKEIYEQYFDLAKEKVVVIQNPFPETGPVQLDRGAASQSKQILYAGRLIKLKNLDILIRAFTSVRQIVPDSQLLIIGEGPEKEKLGTLARKLGLGDRVIFQGSLPQSELLKKIEESYLCVLPSLTEVSPNFVLECIKLGKPILLTKETGIYDQFKDNLIFIDPQDRRDLANKMIKLFDEKNYQDYLAKIKAVKTDWGWDEIIASHLVLFNEHL